MGYGVLIDSLNHGNSHNLNNNFLVAKYENILNIFHIGTTKTNNNIREIMNDNINEIMNNDIHKILIQITANKYVYISNGKFLPISYSKYIWSDEFSQQ